jgi:GWxTD domain-containing protein
MRSSGFSCRRVYAMAGLLGFILLIVSVMAGQSGTSSGSSGAQGNSQPSAQTPSSSGTTTKAAANQAAPQEDPLNQPINKKKLKDANKRWKSEVSDTYKKWLNEEVPYIITDEEVAAFKQLSTDRERDQFIENFWRRRDPTPDTEENEFKEEHYRRIQYANDHYAAGVPGWKTDRGMIYIRFGKPDEVETHPMGGPYVRPAEEGGGSTSTYPFEIWRYRYLEGIGQQVLIEFVDECSCGAYQMTWDRSKKDALKNVPGTGLTMLESMGMANKADRFRGVEQLGDSPFTRNDGAKLFDRLEQYYKLQAPPPIKFKDLSEEVTHKVRFNLLPFEYRADFLKMGEQVLVPVTIQIENKDVTYQSKDGVQRMVVNIQGRISTLTGRLAQTFGDTVTAAVTDDQLQKELEGHHLYWAAVPLLPGRYKMSIIVKDVNGDKVGYIEKNLTVPSFGDTLAASTLILADYMAKVPTSSVGAGNFVLGDTKVRPAVEPQGKPAAFKRSQLLNFYMQVYNLSLDEKTQRASATVDYEIVNTADNKSVFATQENTDKMGNVREQLTIARTMKLANLQPGTYKMVVKVKDNVSQQVISPSASFVVEQ